jgi:hydrogenase maturation protein HypF
VGAVAARFHRAVAAATAEACARLAEAGAPARAVLSGGVWQNRVLLEAALAALAARGLVALRPRVLPPNDGGVAFGQAAAVAAVEGRRAPGWRPRAEAEG